MKLGLIAGYGVLPLIFSKEIKNYELYIAGFKNFTSKKLKLFAKELKLFNLGELQNIIQFFKSYEVTNVVFIGYVPHKILVENNVHLDSRAEKMFSRLGNNLAMSIFKGLTEEFHKEGIKIDPINHYLPHLFADKGEMTSLSLTQEEIENITFGYNIAKEIANLDIGLTIVVKNKIVVSVEGLEGTDKCILRGGKLAGKGCCVIKVARPNQDMRFDLPVIGPRTVRILNHIKASVIAVESGKTLIIDKDKVINKLNLLKIKLFGI